MRGLIVSAWLCVGACQPKIERFDPWDGGTSCGSCETAPVNDAGPDAGGCDGSLGDPKVCEGHCHILDDEGIDGGANPPHSGNHWQRPAAWGEQLGVPEHREAWVQNLECGGVVLLYDCEPEGQCDGHGVMQTVLLERLGPPFHQRVLLTSDPELSTAEYPRPTYAAASWTWVMRFGDMPQDEIERNLGCFIDQHEGNGRVDCPPPD